MATRTAVERQIHHRLTLISLSTGGLPIKANLADRTAIRCHGDQQQSMWDPSDFSETSGGDRAAQSAPAKSYLPAPEDR